MKKAFSIFLLIVFSFNLAGVAILFKIQQFQIRREIKRQINQGIPDNELFAITVSEANASELFWLEDDEFFYQGALYDVVRKNALNDTDVEYYCVNDVLEKKLYANLDALVKHHKSGSHPLGDIVKKLYSFLAGLYFKDREAPSFQRLVTSGICWVFSNTYQSVFLSITSPPPQSLHQLV